MSHLYSIRRSVPNIYSDNMEKSNEFYTGFLEMDLAIHMKWIMSFLSRNNPTARLSIFKDEESRILDSSSIFISNKATDIDEIYSRAKEQDIEIVYPITNEPWKMRHFFVKTRMRSL